MPPRQKNGRAKMPRVLFTLGKILCDGAFTWSP